MINPKGFKSLKDKTNFSFADIASKCGASEQTVRNWYAGIALPRIQYIQKLSELFGIDKDLLLNTLLYVDTTRRMEQDAGSGKA